MYHSECTAAKHIPMAVVTFATVQKKRAGARENEKRQRRNDGVEHSTL